MSLLLEDVAEETAASMGRVADRLDAEVRTFDAMNLAAHDKDFGPTIAGLAQRMTAFGVSHLQQLELLWKWAPTVIRSLGDKEAQFLLGTLLKGFRTGQRHCALVQSLWELATRLNAGTGEITELDRTRHRFDLLRAEVQRALDHRTKGWQPKDTERYAEEMRRIAAGEVKFLTAEEALARLRADRAAPAGG